MKKIYTIDGNNFETIEGFYDEISDKLIPGAEWGHGLDAFNDILNGGFGTPDEGFILIWKNAKKSKKDLGFPETLKWLENGLSRIHHTNVPFWKNGIELAKQEQGETLFMTLIDIILDHSDIELRFE